jgi:integrase
MTTRKAADKFPLWWHTGAGAWCKKYKGRFWYLGQDKDEALARWVEVKKAVDAGKEPNPVAGTLTVRELVNAFLNHKRDKVDAGELKAATWGEYFHACEAVIDQFKKDKPVADLGPMDFARLRASAAKRLGPVALSKFITLVRMLFAFGADNDLMTVPVKFGKMFDKPSRNVLRLEKVKKGVRMIAPADVWKILAAADVQVRAMVWLGLNCGFGQSDCANLQRSDLARRPGWIDYPRPKTGIARRCPLWPETVDALDAVGPIRPDPKDPADADCVFLTNRGNRWVRFKDKGDDKRGVMLDAVNLEFRKACRAAGVVVKGGPYTLRHVFRTVGDEVKDRPAIDLIMGHTDPSVAGFYRELIEDPRLAAITDHVRTWLLAGKPAE